MASLFRRPRSEQPAADAPAARLSVESLEERSVPATLTVTTLLQDNDASNNTLSLSEAIAQANASPGADSIAFHGQPLCAFRPVWRSSSSA